jgi:hypothetical protein
LLASGAPLQKWGAIDPRDLHRSGSMLSRAADLGHAPTDGPRPGGIRHDAMIRPDGQNHAVAPEFAGSRPDDGRRR